MHPITKVGIGSSRTERDRCNRTRTGKMDNKINGYIYKNISLEDSKKSQNLYKSQAIQQPSRI